MGLSAFVEDVLAQVRAAPVDPSLLPPLAIEGSLFSGSPGVAFFLHEAARLRKARDLVPLARRWLDVADAWAARATYADWKELPRGFLLGEAGIAYVDALLSAMEGDSVRVAGAVRRIDGLTTRFDGLGRGFRAGDLLAGAGGIVCLARDLDARLPDGDAYAEARKMLRGVRDRALAAVEAACEEPLREDALLGLAHGAAGELWPLVQVLGADHPIVHPRLAELAALREVDEEGLVFWLQARGKWDLLMIGTWCNGMAGHSLLWTEVARRSRSDESRELARLAAESTAALADRTPGVCCGLAGQSLALQHYAELSGDPRFARRAYDRISRAARFSREVGKPPMLGLWQGTLGVALVALTRLHGEGSFPLIEPLA